MTAVPKPSYSVIIPAYNAEKTIGACLEGVSRQSLPEAAYEIILVDDGSTDATAELARAFDLKYLFQENQGPASARNYGASNACGDIFLFTDSDCVPDYQWIEKMTAPFDSPEVVAVKGAYKTRQTALVARFAQSEFVDRYAYLKKSDSIDMVDTYAAAFRKEIFLKMGGFDQSFPAANNEDTEFSYRLAAKGCRLVFNQDAFVYHVHPETLFRYLKTKFWRGYWRIIVYRRFPGKAVKDSYTPAVVKIQAILMAGSFVCLPLALWVPGFLCPALTAWGFIFFSAIPFAWKTYKTDRQVGLFSPGLVFLRALVFAAGSLAAFLRPRPR